MRRRDGGDADSTAAGLSAAHGPGQLYLTEQP